MSAAADPAGTRSTAGCSAFTLVPPPCVVHYSVGWNCFSNQNYAEWVLLDLEDEMSRSVSTCSQMAFHMVTVRLVQSFGVMECRRNAVSKWKDYWDCVIDISIPQTQFCRIPFLIIHFAFDSTLNHSSFLEIIPHPIRISFSVWLRFDVNVMWSKSIHGNKWNFRLGKCTLTDRGVCKCDVMIGKRSGSAYRFPKASIVLPDRYYI